MLCKNEGHFVAGGDQTMQVVDNAAVFLFNLFMDQPKIQKNHIAQLKLVFGDVSTSQAHLVFMVRLCLCLNVLFLSFVL